jgi:hypothetical protein
MSGLITDKDEQAWSNNEDHFDDYSQLQAGIFPRESPGVGLSLLALVLSRRGSPPL